MMLILQLQDPSLVLCQRSIAPAKIAPTGGRLPKVMALSQHQNKDLSQWSHQSQRTALRSMVMSLMAIVRLLRIENGQGSLGSWWVMMQPLG